MTNENLLKEAIADAKAVKETAIANAKLALEEAFTPHLKSMLSAKLEEMDKDDEDIDESITNEKEEVKEEKEEVEEINLDELLAEIESDLDENKHTDAEEEGYKDGIKKDDKIEAETEKMRFKEAIDEINALKVEVNEVNLLNAKLLYTNKIFKAKNLSEGKKVKVLKAFDKATTVKEAKFIFETLNEGVISSKSSPMINEVKGSASRATGIISEAKKPIIESNDVYDRMRKLAGLI